MVAGGNGYRGRLAHVPAVRLAIAAVILVLLGRAASVAWMNRSLALRIWGSIRPRHVFGSLALLAVVLTVFGALVQLVPLTQYGAGSLVGLTGNAVFAPVEEAAVRSGGAPLAEASAAQQPWWINVAVFGFLAALTALLPWLAYGEERMFRMGLERAGLPRQLLSALRFGLIHLLMLIPIAAALAVGVAGFWYGRVYRAAYRRARAETRQTVDVFGEEVTEQVSVPEARSRGLLASTVWHTTFNTTIVILVVIGMLTGT